MVDLGKIHALLASVAGFTEGPWRTRQSDGMDGPRYSVRAYDSDSAYPITGSIVSDHERHDARLIAAAPDLHRELMEAVGEIERLRAELEKPVAGPWRRELFGSHVRWHASAGEGDRIAAIARPPGDWRGGWIMRGFWGAPESSGPESSDAGRHAADLALLAAGYRLVGGVHPLPDEVRS